MSFLLFLFLLVFPKGGFKIGELPITWGYLLLGLCGLYLLARQRYSFSENGFRCFLFLIPFQLVSLFTLCVGGVEDLSNCIAFVLSFFFLPPLFFLLFPASINSAHLTWIKEGVFWTSLYGIILFFLKFFTGEFLEIPFLTVNYHDLHMLEETKNISRIGVFKLISTYNNGNLFGICMLMLLPLFSELESKRWKRVVVKVALLLTLSRTIWLGLIFYELIKQKPKVINFLFVVLSLLLITFSFNFSQSFFLDLTFGGRDEQFAVLDSLQLLSTKPFTFFYEIVYLGVLERFGIIGFITFMLSMVAPLILYLLSEEKSAVKTTAFKGTLIYLVLCFSDGAMLLIPTMCFYWFLASLMHSNSSFSRAEITPSSASN